MSVPALLKSILFEMWKSMRGYCLSIFGMIILLYMRVALQIRVFMGQALLIDLRPPYHRAEQTPKSFGPRTHN